MSNLRKNNSVLFALVVMITLFACDVIHTESAEEPASSPYAIKRKQMVEYQIKRRGIKDENILKAFLKVERHRFVPKRLVPNAYEDRPLPIGEGQTISQPYIVAYMTQVLNLQKTDKVLEIGTGSGYQAAILGELSDHVFSIEIVPPLGKRAKSILAELGYQNIQVKIGDGYKGWEEYAPFDAIIVTCAPTRVPIPLKEQLKEGGRMIIPVGKTNHQELVYMRKVGTELRTESVLPVRFVPMVDAKGETY